MKYFACIIFPIFVFISCKKEEGKHCPLIAETYTGHLVDLGPVSSFPGVMDSLTKYPQLQAYKVHLTRAVYDPNVYTANVICRVYYKGLLIFNFNYGFSSNNIGYNYKYPQMKIPEEIPVSTEPSISMEQANKIAKQAVDFKHCTISRLGLMNYGTDSTASYKLIWRIKEAESGFPNMDIDAQSGEILRLIKDQIIIN